LVAGGWSLLLLLATAPAQFQWGAAAGRAWSRDILQYYLHSFAIERFPKNGMWEHSRRVLEYAASHGYQNRVTELLLARVALEQKDESAAAAYLRRAEAASDKRLHQDPESPFALYAASQVHRVAQRTAMADSLARQAVQLVTARLHREPRNVVLWALLGHLYQDLGNRDAARTAFAAAARNDPSYSESFRYMLWTGGEDEALRRGSF
jgi:tetratricopeptide (TPR) repeat protein